MSKTKPLQGLLADIATANNEVKEIWDAAGDEPLDAATLATVREKNKQIEEWEHQAKDLIEQRELKGATLRRESEYSRQPAEAAKGASQRQTVGEQVMADEEFSDWLQEMKRTGAASSKTRRIDSPQVALKSLLTGASDTSGGALVVTDRTNIIDAGTFGRPLTVRQLVTNLQTDSDLVEFVRQGTHVNNAAPTAEATATGDGTGAKPESDMVLSIVQAAVKTIAHWIPATRRALDDASGLRGLIDTFLRYGIDEELEDQIVNGAGTGENFTGIFNTSGITTQVFSTDILETARKARTKVRTTGKATPTAYAMHPLDWEAFDLTQDSEARYYFGGPSVMGTPRLWGLPVVESEAFTQGTAMVADWRLAVLWDRMSTQIYITDSHSDFFVRNLIAILAEMRAAFGVIRPAAFVSIDLTA